MTTPTATLTSAAPAKAFTAQPGSVKHVATSGLTGAGIIKHQFKVREEDAWVDNPNFTFVTNKHLHARIDICAIYNQIIVTGADGTTAVQLQLH